MTNLVNSCAGPEVSTDASCPTEESLRQLIAGELPEADQAPLIAHLDACPHCRAALDCLAPLPGTPHSAGHPVRVGTPHSPSLLRLIDQIKSDSPTTRFDSNSTDGDSPTPLDFLSPTDDSAHLGRLGRYLVQEEIGRGASGIVLKALDEQLSRIVALKVLAPRLATNENARRRFVREARAAAAIRDDHVIGIHHVEEVDGLPFLVMEYIVGRSLQQRMDADGPLPLPDILRIGSQIARGLAAAHAQGLVHRDIKPANILLENGVERVKITDFGLAHAVDDVRATQPGVVIGTPEYMSPQQARGERVDHRSDLFSLGCVLYALCAGRPPFRADSTMAILRRICDDTPRPLSEINPDIPSWLTDIINRLISKDPANRFQSAAEVADLLEECLADVMGGRGSCRADAPKGGVGWDKLAQPAPDHLTYAASHSALRTPHSALVRWTAALLLLLAATFAFAESTGLTTLSATVIRIVRGDGTLVVEIDDPNIQVLIDGEELVITGAGPKELRLRPGQHELHTAKDGKPLGTQHITITRDGRQVIKVAREEPAAAAPAGPTTRLAWADAADTSGAPSPDGRYLAFVDWDTGDLAVRDLATGKNRRVTNKGTWSESSEFALSPKFSADGTQLAYTWYNSEGQEDLRVNELDGGNPRVVYSNKIGISPVTCGWTPDGKAIVAELYGRRGGLQLALVGTADGSLRIIKSLELPLESRRYSAGWSALAPDGRTIAYTRIAAQGWPNRDIFLIDIETGQETQLTTHVADKSILAWTPDGRRLLFDMERQGARDAWLIRIVGGKPQGEAELAKKDLGAIAPQGFTRDGTFYYGSSSQGPSLFTATLDLEKGTAIATPLAAEKFNILDRFTLGDWSPDGEHLAYWVRSRESQEMRIVSMKTRQMRVLKPNVNIWRSFRWSPDGRSFIAATAAAEGQKPGVYQIDAISGEATTVFEAGGGGQCIWSRDGRGILYVKRPNVAGERIGIVYRDLQAQTERVVLAPGKSEFDRRLQFWFDLSPDGRQLAFLGAPNGQSMALWLIPVEGGAPRELLKVNSPETLAGGVGWTPDGRFVIFTQFTGDKKQNGLWYISASGGEPRKIAVSGVDAKDVTRIAIHPDGKQLALSASGTGKSEIWALENFLPPFTDPKPAATPAAPSNQP